MEDVLRLYARPYNPKEPVVVLDERPVVLHDAARAAPPLKPGTIRRADYEYVRRGTANIFCILEVLTGRRLTNATKDRKRPAFAKALRKIARRYPHAKTIHLVNDNLNTHSEKSLVREFGRVEGGKLWRRFTIHFTPKHASWLNAAEMEVGLVSRECLGNRRIGDLETLQREVRAWTVEADRQRRSINWKFRVDDARRVFRYDGIKTKRAKH
jgi:transposase